LPVVFAEPAVIFEDSTNVFISVAGTTDSSGSETDSSPFLRER